MVDSRIASGRDGVLEASVIRSEIRSRAELNCALPLFLHPSHQRDTAHRPIGTGRLRARRGFGYWGEQIGHLRDRSGHHFGARRQNSSLQPRVSVETAMAVGSTQAARMRSHERFRRMSGYGMTPCGREADIRKLSISVRGATKRTCAIHGNQRP